MSEQDGRRVNRKSEQPTPGWNVRLAWTNPRPPAVPASLDLNHAEYYAAAAVIGLLAAQIEEPDQAWVRKWALDFGEAMAEDALQRRRKRRLKRVSPLKRKR